jgi:hypothetical protein
MGTGMIAKSTREQKGKSTVSSSTDLETWQTESGKEPC